MRPAVQCPLDRPQQLLPQSVHSGIDGLYSLVVQISLLLRELRHNLAEPKPRLSFALQRVSHTSHVGQARRLGHWHLKDFCTWAWVCIGTGTRSCPGDRRARLRPTGHGSNNRVSWRRSL